MELLLGSRMGPISQPPHCLRFKLRQRNRAVVVAQPAYQLSMYLVHPILNPLDQTIPCRMPLHSVDLFLSYFFPDLTNTIVLQAICHFAHLGPDGREAVPKEPVHVCLRTRH